MCHTVTQNSLVPVDDQPAWLSTDLMDLSKDCWPLWPPGAFHGPPRGFPGPSMKDTQAQDDGNREGEWPAEGDTKFPVFEAVPSKSGRGRRRRTGGQREERGKYGEEGDLCKPGRRRRREGRGSGEEFKRKQ